METERFCLVYIHVMWDPRLNDPRVTHYAYATEETHLQSHRDALVHGPKYNAKVALSNFHERLREILQYRKGAWW